MRDLTKGSVPKMLFKFSMPLLLSTVIQAIINLSDLMVAALFSQRGGIVAGVGLSSQINYLIINAVIGLSTGGGILISQYYGAKKKEDMNKSIHVMISMLIVAAVLLSAITMALSSPILKLLKTPKEALREAKDYLVYTMAGLIFIFLYNGISAVLRGLGDSVRPLIFVCVAAVINIGLDVAAVALLKMGAAGLALATVISQFIAALMSGICLIKKGKEWGLTKYKFSLNKDKLKKLLKIGLPTSIQNTVASLSFLALTYIVNIVGADKAVYALSAASIAFKINSFAVLPSRSMNNSISAMVGQNKGAGDNKRIKKTFAYGLLYGLCFGILFTAATFFFARGLLKIFKADNQTLSFGIPYIKSFAFDYLLLPFAVSQYGLVDGLGKTKVSMWVNSIASLLLRAPAAYVLGKLLDMGMAGIGLAIPLTSLFSAVVMFVYIKTKVWKQLKKPLEKQAA
ncbi:MAG: MATE family efflux transporter [Christensenellales bacterium]|jgi:putative MATE family efflux protein|nr:MATE family efflux transporter [Clostridiales bacterium]